MHSIVGPFRDRHEAGMLLAGALAPLGLVDPVVLALPRGGVPIGYEVARRLHAPLDILLVRKIGAPGYPEFGIGAVVDGMEPHLVIDEDQARLTGADRSYLQLEFTRQLAEIERRRAIYCTGEPESLAGRSVILVDDGIATGGTVKAALKALAASRAREVVLAVPVAPRMVLRELVPLCDRMVFLSTPEPFYAVGAHYADFEQVSDEEVVELLAKGKRERDQVSG